MTACYKSAPSTKPISQSLNRGLNVQQGLNVAHLFVADAHFAELRERSLVYAATAPDDPISKKEGASAQIANYTRKKTIITRALLGSDAGLYGAARIPMSQS